MVSTPMKLSNLLAHCLLGLVDCSSSLVLPKAKNSIPVQIFIPNSSNTDCGEEVVILKKNWKLFYSLTHCVAVWPDLLLLQCTMVQTTCFNLMLNHTGCFFEKIWSKSPGWSPALDALTLFCSACSLEPFQFTSRRSYEKVTFYKS